MVENEKEKRVPNLRFEGFTDDWIQKKLVNLVDVRDGTHGSPKYINNGFPLITSKNLKPNGIDFNDVKYISKNDFKQINKRSNVDKGDILFGMIGTIGNPVLVNDNNFAIKNVALIKLNNTINSFFLLNIFKSNTFHKYIHVETAGNNQKFLALNKIRDFKFKIPKKDEQNKIGATLESIDYIITLEQDKLKNYKTTKEIMDNNIFPSEDKADPLLRFKDDLGWTEYKLKDFMDTPQKEKVEIENSSEILTVKLHLNGVVSGKSRTTLKLGSTNYYRRYSGQFIYGKQNLFNGAMGIVPESLDEMVSSADIPSLNISNINTQFLFSYISRYDFYKRTEAIASGTGSKRVHENELLNLKIMIPNSIVQEKIASIYLRINFNIQKQQLKIIKYTKIKEFLLRNLFI